MVLAASDVSSLKVRLTRRTLTAAAKVKGEMWEMRLWERSRTSSVEETSPRYSFCRWLWLSSKVRSFTDWNVVPGGRKET